MGQDEERIRIRSLLDRHKELEARQGGGGRGPAACVWLNWQNLQQQAQQALGRLTA